jgi:glutathione S-transferase
MITLHYGAQTRSMIAAWILEEIGQPYQLNALDMRAGEHKQPAYLAKNPMGKVPTLEHDGVVVTESSAICAYLADAFPAARLNVPIDDPRRGPYLRWLFFGAATLEPAIVDRVLQRDASARTTLAYGSFETTMDVLAGAVAAGPYLLGDQFTAADVLVGSGLAWARMREVLPERPELLGYMARLMARPALQRVYARDGELAAARDAKHAKPA